MASTYSDLKVELIGTGEQVGTWGGTTNTNLGTALEEAITGSADITFSSVDVTLTLIDSNASQTARHLRLVCTGTSGGARQLILGSGCQIDKLYLVQNDLADAVTIKNTTGTGVTVAAGKKQFVFNNGTNVVAATDSTVNLASDVTGTLPVANGGTGAATLTANNVLLGNGASAVQFVAPSTSGNVLTSNGTAWVSQAIPLAPTEFPPGTVMLFAQTSAPTGWTKDTINYDNSALRIVTGAASTGGSVNFTTAFASQTPTGTVSVSSISGTVGSTTLSTPQIPSHQHMQRFNPPNEYGGTLLGNAVGGPPPTTIDSSLLTGATGGGGSHNHPFSGSGSGTFSGNAINLAVKYVDIIRATKA
jgi:hypothetical protein